MNHTEKTIDEVLGIPTGSYTKVADLFYPDNGKFSIKECAINFKKLKVEKKEICLSIAMLRMVLNSFDNSVSNDNLSIISNPINAIVTHLDMSIHEIFGEQGNIIYFLT